MASIHSAEFKTPLSRLSYAKGLFVPGTYQNDPKATPKFNPTLIFPIKEKLFFEPFLMEVLKQMPKGIERFKAGVLNNPLIPGDGPEAKFKDGDRVGEIKPGLGKEFFFIRPTAQPDKPPAVWWKNSNIQETEATVYSGCYGKGVLNIYAWKDGKGISFGIAGFQKHAEGERLGGAGPIDKEKWSETIADEGEAPAETTGGKGAGGLFGE